MLSNHIFHLPKVFDYSCHVTKSFHFISTTMRIISELAEVLADYSAERLKLYWIQWKYAKNGLHLLNYRKVTEHPVLRSLTQHPSKTIHEEESM